MAINKKLLHFVSKSNFSTQLANSNIDSKSIVFIKDTGEIWTHDKLYSCASWGTNQTNYVPLIIGGTSYNLSKDGHTHSYLPLSGGTVTGSVSVSGSITNLSNSGGGIFWNPYAESASDGSDAASISVATSGGSTVMTIKQQNDANDYINFLVNSSTNGVRINNNAIFHAGNFTNLNQLTTRNFSDLQNKPTTLSGYGITDAYTTSSADNTFLKLAGGTLTGNLSVPNITVSGTSTLSTINQGHAVFNKDESTGSTMLVPYLNALRTGHPVYSDPEFASGNNSISVYNNSGTGTVTIVRQADDQLSANSSGFILKVTSTGNASPGLGGFIQDISPRANAIFAQIFRAKLPVGFSFMHASNSQGAGSNETWFTSKSGTGKWAWYGRIVYCGSSGSFSNGGHVYVNGTASAASPLVFYLASCELYDITKVVLPWTKSNLTNVSQLTNDSGYTTATGHTHSYFTNNLMIKGSDGISTSSSIHLGIGDSDTGFKWISDGKIQMMANNVAVGEWTSSGMNWLVTPKVNSNVIWHAGNFNPDSYLPLTGGTLTSILTIQSGNDSKIILNNTDTETKYQQITFQQNGTEYGRLGTYGSDDLRWTSNIVLHAGNYSSYALPLSGGTMTGYLGFNSNYLQKPRADFRTTADVYTGALTITLPANINNTMVSMWIDVYNYVTNTSFSVHVGGYTYNNSTWADSPFGMVYGADHVIRLGHNGTNFIIYIGETNTTWHYPQVSVRDVIIGYTPSYANWVNDFAISFSASLSVVTATLSNKAWTTKNLVNVSQLSNNSGYITSSSSITGNAATATKLSSNRTFALTGDVTGTITSDLTSGVSIATTIAANSVALGTDTTGNYAASVGVSGNGLTITGAAGEGTAFTVNSNATNANTGSTLVFRDASGNFSAGTITAALSGNASTATKAVATVTGTNTIELVEGYMADNDYFRILVGGTASDAGYAEIATADGGTEPIYVRQYSGAFTSLVRTAALLDANGNTSFPGAVTGGRFYTGYDSGVADSMSCSGWFYSNGQTGWINSTYGGGIYMADSTYVRVSHSKAFKVSSTASDSINTSGGILAGGTISTSGSVIGSAFLTTNSSNYSLILRNSTESALFVQNTTTSGTIASFRYGSATAGAGTSVLNINTDSVVSSVGYSKAGYNDSVVLLGGGGTCSRGDILPYVWGNLTVVNSSYITQSSVKAYQLGHIVILQGTFTTGGSASNGAAYFTIPSSIGVPFDNTGWDSSAGDHNNGIRMRLPAASRTIYLVWSDSGTNTTYQMSWVYYSQYSA